MKAIDLLKQEHELIEGVLDLLGRTISRIKGGKAVPEGFERWAIGFFRECADRIHHRKEEDILFPLLERRGIPREGGPIGVMLEEHEQGRDCVRRMDRAIGETQSNETEFADAAFEYGTLLGQHIQKENQILFEMAEKCLSEEDAAGILKEFELADREQGAHALRERFQTELQQWTAAFNR